MALRSGSLMAAARSASETVHGVRPDERDPAPSQRRPTKVGRGGLGSYWSVESRAI
jgi:hypothetical protein